MTKRGRKKTEEERVSTYEGGGGKLSPLSSPFSRYSPSTHSIFIPTHPEKSLEGKCQKLHDSLNILFGAISLLKVNVKIKKRR